MAESSSSSSGIGFFSALGLLFIGLKLGGVINWSWWLVLAPIWGQVAFIGMILLIAGFIVVMR